MKKILSIALVVVLLAGIAVSGTMAYLTDTDSAVNVMTLGNVQIEQYEQDREGNEFQQGQTMYPIVKPASEKDNNGYPACENYLDKIVTVKNTGKSDAFVRTVIAIPNYTYDGLDEENASFNVIHWNGYSEGDAAPNYPAATRIPGTEINVDNHWYWGKEDKGAWPGNGGDWNMVKAEINGQEYDVYVITHTTALKPNEITAPNMIGIYLDSKVDFDGTNYTYEGKVIEGLNGDVNVLVLSQAVQTAGFDDAFSALTAGFGEVTAVTAAEWFGGVYASKPDIWDGTVPTTKPDTLVVDTTTKTISVNDAAAFAYLNTLVNDANFYDNYGSKWQYTVKLNANIDLNNKPWTPIMLRNFVAFEGNGHTISNLNVSGGNSVGLFGEVTCNDIGVTYVRNFTIDGATVNGAEQVGVVAGNGKQAAVEKVTVKDAVVTGTKYVGGIFGGGNGSANGCTVKDSTITIPDTGKKEAGGLIGYLSNDGKASTVDKVIANNTVENVTVHAPTVASGLVSQPNSSNSGSAVIVIKDNTMKNVTITTNDETASLYVSNNVGNKTVVENNTATGCTAAKK